MNKTLSSLSRDTLSTAIAVAVSTLSSAAIAAPANNVTETIKVVEEKSAQFKVERLDSHKIQTKLLDTPKTINIIDDSLLEAQGVSSLNAALRNVSGVSTFGAGEGGGGNISTNDKLTIRGFSANGNIYIDGVRDIAGYSRDTFNTEQVEVSKGADSSYSGKGTSGGAVNIVSKKAKMEEFASIASSYDTASSARVSGDFNTMIGDNAAIRVNALFAGGGDTLDNGEEEYQTKAIAPALTVHLSEQTKLSAYALIMKQDNTPVLGLPYINAEAADQLGLTEGPIDSKLWDNFYGVKGRDFEKVDVAIGTLVLEHRVNDNLTVRNQTRFGSNDKKSVVSRPTLYSEGARGEPKTYQSKVNVDWTQNKEEEVSLLVNQFDAIFSFNYDRVQHSLVAGLEYYQEDKTSYRLTDENIQLSRDTVDLLNPNGNIGVSGSLTRAENPSKTESTGVAVYALNTVTIDEKLILTAGVRYEDFEAEGSRYTWIRVNNAWTQEYTSGLESSDKFLSWNASVGYKPSDSGFVYISVANSQDPAAGDLAFTWSKSNVERFDELDPQQSKNFEVGTKWDLLNGSLMVNAAAFLTQKTVLDRNEQRVYFLAGEQEAKGFELSLVGNINDQLSLSASYTHQSTKVTKDFDSDSEGDGLTAAPEDSVNVWLNYDLNEQWFFGVGGQYSSGEIYWRRQRAYFDTGEITLVHAMAGYQVTPNLVMQLNIDNLTDKEYVRDFSARGHFRPGAPRNVKLGFNYRF